MSTGSTIGPDCEGVVMVGSKREIDGKIEHETGFYRTFLVWLASQRGVVRRHWSVESRIESWT